MRKKINSRFMELELFTIIITTLIMTLVFYARMKSQVFSDLEIIAGLLVDEGSYEKQTDKIRITVIDPDGSVSFDTAAREEMMENHLDRPEIIDAIEKGSGQGVRMSDTLSVSIFYYARKLENGQILRVGKKANSVFSVLLTTLPAIAGMGILLAIVSLIVSHYLTAAIIRPIDELAGDMEHIDDREIYPELIPFTRKIGQQHDEILASANMRQEFTANVTHELKTPLAAISGYAELMEAGLVNERDIFHFSGEIRKSAARLLSLINDIIRLSQMDAGNLSETLEIVNLAELAAESADMLALSAAKHQVEMTYAGEAKADVRIGRELAQELIYNLVDNAIRYNRPGGRVDVRTEVGDDGTVFSVKDTGIGIPEEHQKRIFERFYRVDKSRSKELGGTGLGLAIVKHICQLTGGEIELVSEPDRGTEITILWRQGERLPAEDSLRERV